jgi:hypothetical protein
MSHRVDFEGSLDLADIASRLDQGEEVILQFAEHDYTDATLKKVNSLCERFGPHFTVRFYAHENSPFDAEALAQIPAVKSLVLDYLSAASPLAQLRQLRHLVSLHLGIASLQDPQILESPSLLALRSLVLSSTTQNNIDLGPLARFEHLTELFVEGHANNIDAIGKIARLRSLGLSSHPKQVGFGFVSELRELASVSILFGGRASISEAANPAIRFLEVVHVAGLNQFTPSEFQGLRKLRIEDQAQLTRLEFEASSRIKGLMIVNCKRLTQLAGLQNLKSLEFLTISSTAVPHSDLMTAKLPETLSYLMFLTGNRTLDREINRDLDLEARNARSPSVPWSDISY